METSRVPVPSRSAECGRVEGGGEWSLCWETCSGHNLLERGLVMGILECPVGNLG